MKLNRVLVIGDIMLDKWTYLSSKRRSPEANVPITNIKEIHFELGGAGNVIRHLENISHKPHKLITLLGNDLVGNKIHDLSEKYGSDFKFVIDKSRRSTLKNRFFLDGVQIFRIDEEDFEQVNFELENEFLSKIEESISKFEVLLFSDYAKGALGEELLKKTLLMARRFGIPTVSDPGLGRIDLYAGCDFVKPNKVEWEDFVRNKGSEKIALEFLFARGTRQVIITEGNMGIRLCSRNSVETDSANLISGPLDVTGAGDSVAAGIALFARKNDNFTLSQASVLNLIGAKTVSQTRTTLPKLSGLFN